MASQVDRFKQLGFPGKDIRHMGVHVKPAIHIVNGEPVETHKIFIGNGEGNFSIDFPTDLIFATMTDPWVFERFTLAGRDRDGVAVLPDSGDFEVRFGDEARKSVVVTDIPKHLFAHRYQMVMRNADTGELVATDPSVDNGESEGSVLP